MPVHDTGEGRTSASLEIRQCSALSAFQGFQVLCDSSAMNRHALLHIVKRSFLQNGVCLEASSGGPAAQLVRCLPFSPEPRELAS